MRECIFLSLTAFVTCETTFFAAILFERVLCDNISLQNMQCLFKMCFVGLVHTTVVSILCVTTRYKCDSQCVHMLCV